MESPEKPVILPLDYATELAMEMHMMRADCADAAKTVSEEKPLDEIGLEECAILDDALARAQMVLQGAVTCIRRLRAARGNSLR
jgi:hypothetical protein